MAQTLGGGRAGQPGPDADAAAGTATLGTIQSGHLDQILFWTAYHLTQLT
jgi:hypothetical protein